MWGQWPAFGVQSAAGASLPPFLRLLGLSAGKPVFTADRYEVDGVSGKVAAFVDWNDPTHKLVQATAANQVAVPVASASFNGQLTATFTGNEWYLSNGGAARWAFLSAAAPGGACVALAKPTTAGPRLCSTRVDTNGFMWGIQGGNNILCYVTNGGAGVLNFGGVVALNTALMLAYRYTDLAATPEASCKVSTLALQTGDSAIAPPAVPESAMVLGAKPGGALAFTGEWPCLFTSTDPGAAGMAEVQALLSAMYGVTP